MRRSSVVAIAALIAAFALAGLPTPAGSTPPSTVREPAPGAFSSVTVPATTAAPDPGAAAAGLGASGGRARGDDRVHRAGRAPAAPTSRPRGRPSRVAAGGRGVEAAPSQVLHGEAHASTTTARPPCASRGARSSGSAATAAASSGRSPTTARRSRSRIVDLYRPDFFADLRLPLVVGHDQGTVAVY